MLSLCWLCPQGARGSSKAEVPPAGLEPALVSLCSSAGCRTHSQTRFLVLTQFPDTRLAEPLEEPRPDLRFRRQLFAPLRYRLRAQRLQLPSLTPHSRCFGAISAFSFNSTNLNFLSPYTCRTVMSTPPSASRWPQGLKEIGAAFGKKKIFNLFLFQYLQPSVAQPPTSAGWLW